MNLVRRLSRLSKGAMYGLVACVLFALNVVDAFTVKASGLTFFVFGVFFTIMWAVNEARVVVPQKAN